MKCANCKEEFVGVFASGGVRREVKRVLQKNCREDRIIATDYCEHCGVGQMIGK